MTSLPFFRKIGVSSDLTMDKERVNLIIKNIEILVEALKKEIDPEENRFIPQYEYENVVAAIDDYDEIYDPGEEV